MEEYFTLIGQFGFPIFTAIYFMIRLEKFLKSNTEALQKLTEVINRITFNSERINKIEEILAHNGKA